MDAGVVAAIVSGSAAIIGVLLTVALGKAASRRAEREGKQRLMAAACAAHGLPVPVFEYPFAEPRKWRFDVLIDFVALEIQGGLFVQGRHTQGAALAKEYEKLNEAGCLGYSVLLVTPEQVESGEAWALVQRALAG